jgi:hypothetical protein
MAPGQQGSMSGRAHKAMASKALGEFAHPPTIPKIGPPEPPVLQQHDALTSPGLSVHGGIGHVQ